ncbi:hypothetical protein Dsin_006450 [Dipteronia sinensis]|uniref:Pentatricopeptide repeat-containing protein n=1 Tax=Dipteronia sinensis TaxID=43782 RepID=A0AAE0AYE5_9ROSI|nr:hypothetical protein Dsin_006450 [Dipteronia sinensis]
MPPNTNLFNSNIIKTVHLHQSLLQKCKNKYQLNQVHALMITTGLIHHPPSASKLVASFASSALSGTTSTAFSIADQIKGLDSYTWNTIIRGYLEENKPKQAILVYSHMRKKALKVDAHTLLFVTKACGFMSRFFEAVQIHAQICKLGFVSNVVIQTALLNVYGPFDMLIDMQQVFDEMPERDSVTWNSLIAVYARQNCTFKVLDVLRRMIMDHLRPNGMTVVSILSALSTLREGKMIHCYMIRNLVDFDVFGHNALICMYSKCGCLLHAQRIFQMMPIKNVVSWTSMISAYSDNNHSKEALALFKEMESKRIKPDEIAMLSVVSMCSKSGSFELGEWIDHYVEKNGIAKESSVYLANALLDMHAKCGNINKACQIFDEIQDKTLVSWTSIIHGLAMHGQGVSALVRFCQMQIQGFKPDGIVFQSVLSACSHAGLVDEGLKCFDSMVKDHHLEPWTEHYGGVVDLLCRAGFINEAFEFIVKMPITADAIVWRILLRACQEEGDINLANQVMKHFDEFGPNSCEDYIVLSNLNAMASNWDAVGQLRNKLKVSGVINRHPGCSSIEIKS